MRVTGVAAVVLLIVSGTPPVMAAPAGTAKPAAGELIQAEPVISREALTSDTRLEIASVDGFAELGAVAATEGTVRVIVTLQMLWAPEQMLDGSERASQAETIAARQQRVIDALGTTGYRVLYRYRYIPVVALELDTAALAELEASGLAARVELDELDRIALTESVPLINADDVWAAGYDGSGRSVAILDTGVDSTHSFLSGRVVGEACFSATGDCPGGGTEAYGSGVAAPCSFDVDACAHGTHVSGIAAGDNLPALAGVAPGADVVAVQVFSDVGGAAASYNSDQLAALEYVYSVRDTYNVASVNMSIGSSLTYASACDYDSRKLAIDNLLGAGVATVIAAGNGYDNNGVSSPGCISTAVTVASSTKADVRSDFSNIGELVDVFAPGSDIYSSIPGGWATYNGTSMAAPHVTGAWALLKQAYPNAGVNDILSALQESPVVIPASSWYIPRIDVADALGWLAIPRPENDQFEAATPLGSPATVDASNVRATTQSGEPLFCFDPVDGPIGDFGATVWYQLQVAYPTIVTIDTAGSNFDTILGLYQGDSVDTLFPVACNDDVLYPDELTSMLVTGVAGGESYWLQVGGYAGDTGSLVLDVSDAGDMSSPPTWTSKTLTASDVFTDRITVSWPSASDDYGVTGYRVYRNGSLVMTTTSRTYTATGLTANTSYTFEIEAYDAGDHRTVGPNRAVVTARDFIDTDGLIFEEDIEWLSGAAITQGCNPPVNDMFCPNDYVTRGQMAAFLVRALGLSDRGSMDFVDDDGSVFEGNIEMLATAGITKGCNAAGDMFCPNNFVTRGQMAAFLRRALS